MKQIAKQVGGIGKSTVKQVVHEPIEILKGVGEQVGVRSEPGGQHQPQGEQRQEIKVSPEQKRRGSRLLAIEQEIKEIREREQQAVLQQQAVEEQQKEQLEGAKKESILQKWQRIVTGRFKGRIETRLPKAA